MLSLFSQTPTEAGFRLYAAEVLNWGTFDGHIYAIAPQGENSLLTGANGSGKTTYIDALLTLLVPEKRMRFYNQSAGTAARNERTEESYVLGEYGQTEHEKGREVQRLRDRKTPFFSVLLARFFNQGTQQWLSLFQVRWFGNGSELKRSFGLAQAEMSIAKHFAEVDNEGRWKKTLRQHVGAESTQDKIIQFFDLPGEYSRSLRKQLGMRSEKSQSLFSQTIGLKVLGNLNQFIRSHMLEEAPAEAEFEKLRDSYKELRTAYKTLKKLRQQLDLLTPVEQYHEQWQTQGSALARLQDLLEKLPVYKAQQRLTFIAQELTQKQQASHDQQARLEALHTEQEVLEENLLSLETSIRSDESGRRLKDLEKEIREHTKAQGKRQKHWKHYHKLVRSLGLPEIDGQERFEANKAQLVTFEDELTQRYQSTKDKHIFYRVEKEKQAQLLIEQARELQALRQRRNNIHGDEARIRAELIQHLGVSETEIPFVGELLQIKGSENRWEMAIEKVLHNFALHLLVPEPLIPPVNAWVHNTRLNGRIRYFKIAEGTKAFHTENTEAAYLPTKLEIHPETPYKNWLSARLTQRFAYLCTDDLGVFQRSTFALTTQGLIRDREKHQKDDRSHTFQRHNYVLGWDNTAKIKHLEGVYAETENELKALSQQIAEAEKQEKQWQHKLDDVKRLQEEDFSLFEDLDHLSLAAVIAQLEQEKAKLEAASDHIRLLESQLKTCKQQKKDMDKKREQLTRQDERLQTEMHDLAIIQSENQQFLSHHSLEHQEQVQQFFKQEPPFAPALNRTEFEKQIKTWQSTVHNQKQKTEQNIYQIERALQTAMHRYKSPEADILQQFSDWPADTYTLGNGPEYVEDYLAVAAQIRSKELIEQETRFQQYFNHSIVERMTSFEQFMERERENIEENIAALNRALKGIDFRSNPQTYIQIKANLARAGRATDFREKLRSWKPVAAESNTAEALEKSFEKIQALIDELEQRPDWRKEVIDVRNWMTFSAQEFYTTDQHIARTYETTGKLSGGEKAQLTYTILAAALAYQFNISQEGNDIKSFRFICVDESFSNQDDEKAVFLMNLCKQLHLQLLVVTPNDKTHVVEPYISRVHLVLRRDNKNSVLYDMPITTYQEQLHAIAPSNTL